MSGGVTTIWGFIGLLGGFVGLGAIFMIPIYRAQARLQQDMEEIGEKYISMLMETGMDRKSATLELLERQEGLER